jgi:arylsulfatase A
MQIFHPVKRSAVFISLLSRLMRLLVFYPIGWLCAAVAPALDAKPNVLLIVTDDQGYGDFGFTGNPHLKTPRLDALAKDSARFERFYVNPLCAPTRAALLTGRYSLRTGVYGVSRGEETMREEETTVAELLRDAGWRTGLFGKWHNGENFPYTPNGQGFQHTLGFNLGHWNNYFDTTLRGNNEWVKTQGWISDALTQSALQFIEKNRAQPWFCYLSYNAPHSPFQCPDTLFNKYKKLGLDDTLAAVYGMCEDIDRQVGRVLGQLERWSLAENTMVIFLTDNGPNTQRFNGGLRGKKGTLYEGGVRTPCLLRYPARVREARVISQIAAHIDLLPTLCELTGVAARTKNPIDGRSLVPLLEGRTEGWPDREIFIQNTPRRDESRTQGSVVTQRFHAVNAGKSWELYELTSDPGEKRDLAAGASGEARMILDDLTAKYERWWSQVSEGVVEARPPIPAGLAEENPVEASAAQAELEGGLKFSGKHANNAWIVGWRTVEARVQWTFDIRRSGAYEITAAFTLQKGEPATKLAAVASSQRVEATVSQTAVRQIPSPDRVPREEVYEMEWQALALGRVELAEGRQTITVSLDQPNDSFALKHLALRRIE